MNLTRGFDSRLEKCVDNTQQAVDSNHERGLREGTLDERVVAYLVEDSIENVELRV
jgi:hypothetical protein